MMSNSTMVVYTELSPNHSGKRTALIDRITPHCVVGQCTAEGLGEWFACVETRASSNYGIDRDGRIGMYVEEKNRSWCTSSNANDQRAVTIECASDLTAPYAMNPAVYETLVKLCVDICRRNKKKRLLWLEEKKKTLSYIPAEDEMVLAVHRWFANKSCPGDWLYSRLGDLAWRVTAALSGTQATEFAELSEAEAVKKAGPMFTKEQKRSGILASVSLAQFILESGYGKTELAQNANNCFGMKKSLSGNTWSGSMWDGTSIYTKQTKEQNKDGTYETIKADFRKYFCVEDSIADHSAYLLGAMNGDKKRYEGIAGVMDYREAAQMLQRGGYATLLDYAERLCSIIEKWDLTQYDVEPWYRVRKAWDDEASQKGAYKQLENARACADENEGYCVFDWNGKAVYTSLPYRVRVSIPDLNIRKGPGTDFEKTGLYTDIGVFTIVEEADGKGAGRWGRLKSGAGWISLDFAEKI